MQQASRINLQSHQPINASIDCDTEFEMYSQQHLCIRHMLARGGSIRPGLFFFLLSHPDILEQVFQRHLGPCLLLFLCPAIDSRSPIGQSCRHCTHWQAFVCKLVIVMSISVRLDGMCSVSKALPDPRIAPYSSFIAPLIPVMDLCLGLCLKSR